MRKSAFDARCERYRNVSRAIAIKLAGVDDPQLLEDLEQEGLLALWDTDLRAVRSNEDSFIKFRIHSRLVDYLRHTKPDRYSLFEWDDDALARGCVVGYSNYNGYRIERQLYGGAEAVVVDPWVATENAIEVECLLAQLDPHDRDLIQWSFDLTRPEAWFLREAPRLKDVARRLYEKYGVITSEAAVRFRRDEILRFWRGQRKRPRRNAARSVNVVCQNPR